MKKLAFQLILVIAIAQQTYAQNHNLRLWYDQPAKKWEETLPLGNGRLGMMPDGGFERETIVLNDITLWSGAPEDADNPEASKYLPQIRRLLLEGKNDEAEALINQNFVCKGEGSGRGSGANVPFGCYQVLGELQLKFDHGVNAKPLDYKRDLTLNNATATTTYTVNGVQHTREYFTSFGDDVSVVKIKSSKAGQLNFSIGISRPEKFSTIAEKNVLVMTGQLTNGNDGNGMKYMVKVIPVVKGGKLKVENNTLVIEGANEVMLLIGAGTSFRNENEVETTNKALEAALNKSFDDQKKLHVVNFQKLFNRLTLSIGGKDRTDLPTDKRLSSFAKDADGDTGLPILFFQYGRYLSISSTRVGLLPPNLQGLWANQIQTPWNGDYHLDVNVQMNHWLLGVTNLSELNLPLAQLSLGIVNSGEKTAKAYYDAKGWVAHVITNVWGFTSPGEDASWGATTSGSGWLCNNLWDHYAFTGDKKYLAEIYPILKGSAEFYNSVLIEEPKSKWLVTAPSVSPENSFFLPNGKRAAICMGPTIDNQITRELFSNVIAAAQTLGFDKEFSDELKSKLSKLPPAGRVASDGRLMEWLEEYKETDPKHRHISHLYGLYPASLITPSATPELAEACKKTLEVRGDDSPGWSKAYKLLFWARLQDGNRSYKLLKELLKYVDDTELNYSHGGGSYANLLTAHPPFQIDGNFGGTAGIAEMFIQSHEGYINLLPAIPDAWKSSGEIKGLRARGNFSVDIKWNEGKVTSYKVYSPEPKKVRVKIDGEIKEITAQKM